MYNHKRQKETFNSHVWAKLRCLEAHVHPFQQLPTFSIYSLLILEERFILTLTDVKG